MTNQTVIVRDFQGEPLVRKVWKVANQKVYVFAEGSGRSPIGFPREDVFSYDPKHLPEIEKNYRKNPSIWNRLTQWPGEKNGDK
jgi:hypothetical protein